MTQILATFCATYGCLLNGTVIGYSAPAIPSLLDPESILLISISAENFSDIHIFQVKL
jgi:hypothetical protein